MALLFDTTQALILVELMNYPYFKDTCCFWQLFFITIFEVSYLKQCKKKLLLNI
jgi:hypothetical protein